MKYNDDSGSQLSSVVGYLLFLLGLLCIIYFNPSHTLNFTKSFSVDKNALKVCKYAYSFFYLERLKITS